MGLYQENPFKIFLLLHEGFYDHVLNIIIYIKKYGFD